VANTQQSALADSNDGHHSARIVESGTPIRSGHNHSSTVEHQRTTLANIPHPLRVGHQQQAYLSDARCHAADQTITATVGTATRIENASAIDLKEKNRFSIPIDLLVQIYNTKKEDQTFDERIEELLRLGMTEEGKL